MLTTKQKAAAPVANQPNLRGREYAYVGGFFLFADTKEIVDQRGKVLGKYTDRKGLDTTDKILKHLENQKGK